MIYLDPSAIVKLLRTEPHSESLHLFLSADEAPPLFTSQLTMTEVKRALHAAGDATGAAAVASLSPPAVLVPGHRVLALPITAEIVLRAGDLLPGSALRTLDALHIATAHEASTGLTALVTYDARMLAAAATLDLPLVAPGAT